MQVLALVWGILSLLGMLVAFVPCLGSLNWINIPFSVIGVIISVVAVTSVPQDKKGSAIAGIVMCGIAAFLGLIRLAMGGGIV